MTTRPNMPIGTPKFRTGLLRAHCDAGCYLDTLPDWNDLFDEFPRGIRPTDVDGLVEVNNHFLFLEEKGLGVDPPAGQSMALARLSMNDGFTVILWRPALCSEIEVRVMRGDSRSQWKPGTRAQLKQWLSAWAATADAKWQPPIRHPQGDTLS